MKELVGGLQARGTSVYLVQKRIDMLPKLLTTDLCSLRGNVERLAFSVLPYRPALPPFPAHAV